jgi:hypothetical protein
VLDLGLLDKSGVEVIGRLSDWTTVRIIVLSGRAGSLDWAHVLVAGTDRDVTKPVSRVGLLARIRAITRRSGPTDAVALIEIGVSRINLADRTVEPLRLDDLTPRLTRTECGTAGGPGRQPEASSSPNAASGNGFGGVGARIGPSTCARRWLSFAATSRTPRPTLCTCSPSRNRLPLRPLNFNVPGARLW